MPSTGRPLSNAVLESLNRPLELNPGNGSALQILGDYYEVLPDYDKSIQLGINSMKAEPNSVGMRVNLGLNYKYAGRSRQAVEVCATGAAPENMSPWSGVCVAEAYIGLGDFDNAVRHANAVLGNEHVDQTAEGLMAIVLGAAGFRDRAQEIKARLEELAKSEYVSPTTLAFCAFGAGDVDQFFSHIEMAIAEKAAYTPWFASIPHFASVHSDPRFAALVAKLNLPSE